MRLDCTAIGRSGAYPVDVCCGAGSSRWRLAEQSEMLFVSIVVTKSADAGQARFREHVLIGFGVQIESEVTGCGEARIEDCSVRALE